MNLLPYQVLANGGRMPDGPHFVHCYLYEGQHCSCGGNYRGPNPGPALNMENVLDAAELAAEREGRS